MHDNEQTPQRSGSAPLWTDGAPVPAFPRLDEDSHADVVVIGAGITGLTAAYLVAEAGRSVVVLERGAVGQVDTGHTSAHVTMVTDARLTDLVRRFGRPHAQAAWDAGYAGIATIDRLVRGCSIACGFEWVDGYLHAPAGETSDDDSQEAFREEAALAADLGFDAEFLPSVPLMGRWGVRFANQARIHPRLYLAGLARAITELGGRIHEHSGATDVGDSPRHVVANGHTVRCDDVVVATHSPQPSLVGTVTATILQTKLALYTSYVVAARIRKNQLPDALWWDTANPYQYVRIQPGSDHDVVIVGGADHKTGQADDTPACHGRLEAHLRAIAPDAEVTHRWSGQVIETADGLPYVGRTADHRYVGTGFAGNGLTFGTLGGLMCADAIIGRSSPWDDLFDPDRSALRRGLRDYVTENADYPYYMIRDRFAGSSGRTFRSIRRGEGAVVEHDGQRLAVYRAPDGEVSARSAICTHLGCVVAWNSCERTWDCPCHGSRFGVDGAPISGPAESPLPPAKL